ncbi:MAG TPA: hypothetical protein VJK54_11540 [Chthoniobacterales bacterium]|nr:hypothetical protein [Chthoniobacterales bacterium]
MIIDHPIPTLVEEPVETSDSIYTVELIAALEEADAAIDRGEFVTFEEIKKEFASWVTK